MEFSKLFRDFANSEKSGGFVLITFTVVSLLLSNWIIGPEYVDFFHKHLDLSFLGVDLDYSVEHWVNDGLMAVFFLLVGLEIERELYVGELSSFQNAILPILAAIGGMVFPALIHFAFNVGTESQSGFGIPMATDIAFALGILSLAGNRVPFSLKIFLTALAIIDDLGAISVIALFYTHSFSMLYFLLALLVFGILFFAGKRKVYFLPVYIIGGIVMWYLMLKSGIHATIAGVLLAFAIPFHKEDEKNPSYKLQHYLHKPVAFIILPIFALVNTAIMIPDNWIGTLKTSNSLGILVGLVAGKFVGIFLISFLAVKFRLAKLATDLNWKHVIAVSFLGGIGFTMSMFISNLAFNESSLIVSSKMSILIASVVASVFGLFVLRATVKLKN